MGVAPFPILSRTLQEITEFVRVDRQFGCGLGTVLADAGDGDGWSARSGMQEARDQRIVLLSACWVMWVHRPAALSTVPLLDRGALPKLNGSALVSWSVH